MNRFVRPLVMIAVISVCVLLTLAAFGLPVLPSVKLLYEGAFADKVGWARTLIKSTPLMLTGLGAAVAWRAGIYNIGGEGQFLVGAGCGAWFAKLTMAHLPGFVELIGILACCALGGALWASVAGLLYVKRGVEVVISTILLNFVALQMLDWAVSGPLQEAKHQLPQSDALKDAMMLPKLNRQLDLHVGILLAIVICVGVALWMKYTKAGFRLRLVGASPSAARANGVPAWKVQLSTLAMSGALCGLAGGVEYSGVTGLVGQGFSQQWGFLGIPVALIANLSPMGVVPSALFGGALFAGSENLARFTPAGSTLVFVIQAAVVLGTVGARKWLSRPPNLEVD